MTVNTHRHQTFKPYVAKIYGNHACQKRSLIHGELHVCGEPTTGGKTYCEQCNRRLITLTDRVPPEALNEPHPWRKPMKL